MNRRGFPCALAADYLGISPSKFRQLVAAKKIPAPRLIDSKRVWDKYDLDDFFDNLPRDGESTGWEGFINDEA